MSARWKPCAWTSARRLRFAAVGLALLACAARAQRTVPSVYVLDFNNRTTVGGQLLGRIAAAQVALQLIESPNWDVVPDAQVQRAIQQLGLPPPFDRIDRARIANAVDATAVCYGDILEARVTSGRTGQAYTRIRVIIEDVRTQAPINGALMEGHTTPRPGYEGDADVLLEGALFKAAFRAREAMERFRAPEGTVLNTTVVGTPDRSQLDALINIGARQGVKRGMELIVTRRGEPVGRLRVSSVDSDVSTARVVENVQGVRPEDHIRAVFDLENSPAGRVRR